MYAVDNCNKIFIIIIYIKDERIGRATKKTIERGNFERKIRRRQQDQSEV